MKLSVFPSSMETARSLIFHLVDIMNAEPDKTFNIAVSGGSTPALMFDLWANEYADITPWKRMKLYWVDERCVPPEDSDSNYGMMRSLLLGIVPIPYENVYRIRGEEKPAKEGRFELVEKLEAMAPEERFAFWQNELSRCIRCNACRNVCPACSCIKCVFDNDRYDTAQKANTTTFEEQMFHIIRAFHVAGRCTDCGECSRVCPQHIPLHLLNRKFIKDIDEFYGEYQAGADTDSRAPLTNFTQEDVEPSIVKERG